MKRTERKQNTARGQERVRKQQGPAADAYMTVEASFVVPMAVCLIVLVIYLSFYMYNKCLLTQDCARTAIRTAALKEGNICTVPPEEEIFRDHYFMADRPSVSNVDGSNVRVTASENMRAPAMQGYFLMPGGGWQLRSSFTARKTDPPAGFRKYKRILDLAARTCTADVSQPADPTED